MLGWFGWLIFTFHHHHQPRKMTVAAENACFSFEESFASMFFGAQDTWKGVSRGNEHLHAAPGGWLVEQRCH